MKPRRIEYSEALGADALALVRGALARGEGPAAAAAAVFAATVTAMPNADAFEIATIHATLFRAIRGVDHDAIARCAQLAVALNGTADDIETCWSIARGRGAS